LDINKIIEENKILKQKLSIAEFWMQREVKNYINKISKDRFSYYLKDQKDSFFSENIEQILEKSIYDFFWEYVIASMSAEVIENIISWEILYYSISKNKATDWLWVISSYHKSMDILIEEQVTKPFRKYFNSKYKNNYKLENDLLEKSLSQVLNSWYILWLWRLFQLIKNIKEWEKLWFLSNTFKEFLDSNIFIKEVLLEDDFFDLFEEIIEMKVLWEKRHNWKIDFSDVKKSRLLLMWEFKEKNCIIYKLANIWVVDF